MAFAPLKLSRPAPARKGALLGAGAPNYQDFSTPPNGDFVRYVEGLMRWGEQEQERLRLKALSDKTRSTTDSQWGRTAATPVRGRDASAAAQPGSTETPVERWKRKVQAQAAKLQQPAVLASPSSAGAAVKAGVHSPAGASTQHVPRMPKSLPMVLFFGAMVAAGIFAQGLLPFIILGWVAFNVIRAVRAASSPK